jgi:Bacterial PH domain/Protein of unknown function (DUF1648)
MSVFETDSRLPFTAGIITIVAAVIGAVAAIIGAFLVPVSFTTFAFGVGALGLLILAGWLGWQLTGYVQSNYTIDRNAFVIRWGFTREIIPMGDVQRVIAAIDIVDGLKALRVPLPGWWRAEGFHPAMGKIRFYATESIGNQIVIVTPDRNYAVSPYDAEGFLDSFRARFEMRPTQQVKASLARPSFFEWPFWRDRAAHILLALAIALNLGVFGLSSDQFPDAPAQIPLHFDAAGIPDRLGPRTQLFAPALTGLALLIISIAFGFALYARKQPLPAYLLWGGAAVVQALFLVSAITIGFTGS